eukprot:3938108-Rhodomonas_salina.1
MMRTLSCLWYTSSDHPAAGYTQEMSDLLSNNPGLRRRFNMDDFGLLFDVSAPLQPASLSGAPLPSDSSGPRCVFQDLSSEEMRTVLIRKAAQEGMPWESARVVSEVVEMLVQRQRLPNFGNSGAIASLLNVAKVRVSLRLSRGEGGQALRLEDFSNRDAVQHSDDPWSRMHHTEHVQSLLHDLGAFVHAARADGLPVSSLMQQWHLIVTGPSGTGKTTTGQLMGAELHRLGLLPSATVIAESGQSLQGQYIGQTKELVVKAMERARGGVLLIDDAH